MTTKPLDCIEINTGEPAEFAVIWLHGLGASGDDFVPVVPELNLPQSPGIRFIFPHAPVRPISINGGAPMRGWYDIDSLDFGSRQQDTAGIQDSAQQVRELINQQVELGVAAKNIVLAGFSQGGAIALYEGLTGPHELAGIMALSTYLPIQDITLEALNDTQTHPSVFMAHGDYDDVIQVQHATQSRDVLLQHKVVVEWQSYPMAHSVSEPEIHDIANWLKRQFGL